MHGWAPEVIGAIGTPHTSPAAYLDVFFTRSAESRQAGTEALRRRYARTVNRDTATTWATRETQYDAICTWGIPDHALLQRLMPLVALTCKFGRPEQEPPSYAGLIIASPSPRAAPPPRRG